MVVDSGYSSYMYNQNIYPVNNVKEQGVSLALALSELVLKGEGCMACSWRRICRYHTGICSKEPA